MPAGRPSLYSDALVDEICERLARGESMRRICSDDHIPEQRTIDRWLDRGDMGEKPYREFVEKHARARTRQGDFLAAQTIEIADTEEDANRAKVRVAARQWYAAKLVPKRYGEKVQQEHSGSVEVAEIPRTRIAHVLLGVLHGIDVAADGKPPLVIEGETES